MIKKSIVLTLCLSVFVALLFLGYNYDVWENQNKIEIEEVDSIYRTDKLSKISDENNNTSMFEKKFTDGMAKQFVDDWNNAKSIGPVKSMTKYFITIYQKDGSKRHFRANGKTIKEKNDYGFQMKNESYFENLWESTK